MRAFAAWGSFGTLALAAASTANAAGPLPQNNSAPTASSLPVVMVPTDKASLAKSPPNLEAMFAIFDKLFPPQPDPDPARLALARTTVTAMWPDGAYGKMMTGFMGGIFDRVMDLKKSDFAVLDPKAKLNASAGTKDLSLREQAAAKDPNFNQRMTAMREVVGEELGKVSAIIDPRIREGLARSMARRFDQKQLNDINAFYMTPSGQALASQSMQLWVDPDMMRSLFGAMPEMMKMMPDIMQKVKAVDDRFPKPPKPLVKGSKPARP
jgi:Uncharacterized protein conserved in bacteria (DUF2059)